MRRRLYAVVRKLPYYLRSLVGLARLATLGSIARTVLTRDKRLRFRDGTTLELSSVVDLLVVKETLVDDVYGIGSLEAGGVVVDVGAGIGDFALAVARRLESTDVIAFEPNPRSFRTLERNLRSSGSTRVRAFQVAIGTEQSYVLRRLDGPRSTASALAHGAGEGVLVAAQRLDEAVRRCDVRLLKIDCEGLELDVLRSAVGILRRVERIVLEYHNHLLADADRLAVQFLEAHGFRTRLQEDAYDRALGYVHAVRG